jgi:hypothetical protein
MQSVFHADSALGKVADYLESLGWAVDTESATEKQVVIPERFSNVYEEYNSLQKAQGFDLSQLLWAGASLSTH